MISSGCFGSRQFIEKLVNQPKPDAMEAFNQYVASYRRCFDQNEAEGPYAPENDESLGDQLLRFLDSDEKNDMVLPTVDSTTTTDAKEEKKRPSLWHNHRDMEVYSGPPKGLLFGVEWSDFEDHLRFSLADPWAWISGYFTDARVRSV